MYRVYDMIMKAHQLKKAFEIKTTTNHRTSIDLSEPRWPNGRIPFEFAVTSTGQPVFTNAQVNIVLAAVQHFNTDLANTCSIWFCGPEA